jgi:hypothetical protein
MERPAAAVGRRIGQPAKILRESPVVYSALSLVLDDESLVVASASHWSIQ